MPLTPGSRFGSFEVTSQLGAGGMGEVYRARDTRLDRAVAIKILLESFASDPDRLARFEREAKLLASLNHPHIAQVYGLEENGATRALVMELVEGPTLADRIAEGPVPLDEALAIARQIANALGAAHEQGIVHRDLKPANVKVRPDGTVKVLDFGLAKLAEPGGAGGSDAVGALTMSPTITSPAMTRAGVILGTAAYMSPEQARGRAVDKRADIWAFGVVLYEMLVGQRPFKGDDLTETIAAVVRDQPDLGKTPVQVRRLIARCLEKDPRQRLHDIGDVWDLRDDRVNPGPASAATAPAWRRVLPWGTAAAFALLAAVTALPYLRQASPPSADVVRFQMSAGLQAGGLHVALSPDGRHLAYQVGNRIVARDLDAIAPRTLAMTDSAVATPFWTADSRFVVYDGGGKLTKIDASGGPPQALCDLSGIMLGGFGTRDDRIVFVSVPGGIRQVPARGGESAPLGTVRLASLRAGSQLLPDGRRFVYAGEDPRLRGTAAGGGIYIAALDGSGEPVRVLSGDIQSVAYVTARDGGDGYLVFNRGRTLLAQRLDSVRNELVGEPVVVADRVGLFSVSESGTLVHTEEGEGRRLVWMDRQGKQIGTAWSPADYNELRLSPDASRVAVVRATGTKTWIYDFAREAGIGLSPLVSAVKPVWSPDGSRIVFAANRGGAFDLYVTASNGTGGDAAVLASKEFKYPLSWSPDGRWLLYTNVDPVTKEDLWAVSMAGAGERRREPVLVTNYRETDGAFSPDGRFVAYVSDESGTPEVYVRSFPSSGGKWPVSNGGGYQPRWRADGNELFYLSGRSQLMSVDTTPGKEFEAGSPKALFTATVFGGGPTINNWYWDVAPDGKRMLFNAGSTESGTALVTVVLNWQAGLKTVGGRP